MDRKRVVTVCMIVTLLGAFLSMVGAFTASGLDQGGSLSSTLHAAFMGFMALFWVSIAFHSGPTKTKQNQSQAEKDSSLV
jgi:arginine exporter protein ArgO